MAATADPHKGFHVFLSYRREGTSAHAGRLHDFLVSGVDDHPGLSDEQIFMDIDTIQPGDDFRDVIADAVARCHVFLAVIGKQWADTTDAQGRRRLDNPGDYVRVEIEAALERKIPVIPILVDGAQMPAETELPESISALVFRNGVELSDKRWRYDVGQLLTSLKKRESAQQTPPMHQESSSLVKAQPSTATPSSPRSLDQLRHRPARVRTSSRLQVTKLFKFSTGKEVNSVRFTPDGNHVLTGEDDGFIHVFDLADPSGPVRELRFRQWGLGVTVLGLAVARSAPRIAVVGQSSKLQVFDYETSAAKANFAVTSLNKSGFGCAFGADDTKLVASSSEDGTARIWNWETGKEILQLEHGSPVYAVAFALDGSVFAAATEGGEAAVWDSRTGDRLATIDHDAPVRDVAAEINGDVVATASLDESCSIWDARHQKEITRVSAEAPVFCVAVSPVDGLLCTGCYDGTITLWNLEGDEANPISHLALEGEPVLSVALSPRGTHVAAGGKDEALQIWQIGD